MGQTCNQKLENRLNTLSFEISKTQNEMNQRNSHMEAKMATLHAHMENNFEYFVSQLKEMMTPTKGSTSLEQPYNPEGIDSSHS